MKKSILILIVVVVIIVLGIGGYFYWKSKQTTPEQKATQGAGEAAQKITEGASQGVLPSVSTNPLENKPDVNPVDKINPFKDIKTNPFE